MATTYTTNLGLQKPAFNDRNWHTPILATIDLLDTIAPIGPLAVRATTLPSTTLFVRVAAGVFRASDGTLTSYAGAASQAVTASTTNYVFLSDAGVLTVNTTGYPAATFHVRLATVTTSGSAVTGIVDDRIAWESRGVVRDASASQAVVTLGNTDAEIGGLTISAAYSQAEVQALRDRCEELADDVRNLSTLLHAIRTALVNQSIIKGSA